MRGGDGSNKELINDLVSVLESLNCVIVNKHVVNKINKVSEERVKELTRLLGSEKASKLVRKSVLSDEQAYKLSLAKLSEADVVVCECSAPSFGVGYEARHAIEQSKKVICCYNTEFTKGARPSIYITGNPLIHVVSYASKQELRTKLRSVLSGE